jgi:hypothetical protein
MLVKLKSKIVKAEAFKQIDWKLNFGFRKKPWGPKPELMIKFLVY